MNPAILFYLIAGHFLCDYPLQGEFLANAKAKGPLRLWHLFGHSVIHGAVRCRRDDAGESMVKTALAIQTGICRHSN